MSVVMGLAVAFAQNPPIDIDEDFEANLSNEVLAVLGGRQAVEGQQGRIELGASLRAEFGVRVECGQIKIDGDLDGTLPDVSDLPEQMVGMGTQILSSAPMLVLCHTSPSICAELKNLNIRIDEDWDFHADLCRSIDAHIDSQAEKGREEARDRAKERCMSKRKEQGASDRDALRDCEEQEDYLVTDKVQGFVTQAFSDTPQRLLRSALDASQTALAQNPEFYEFLVAIGGEAEIQHNGVSMPLFSQEGSLTAKMLSDNIRALARRVAGSSQLRNIVGTVDPETGILTPGDTDLTSPNWGPRSDDLAMRFWSKEMYVIFSTEFSLRDYDNLHALDTATAFMFEDRWGDVVAKELVVRLSGLTKSELEHMTRNPALSNDEKVRIRDIGRALDILKSQLDRHEIESIPQFRLTLERAADRARQDRREIAGALAESEERNQRVLGLPACNSFKTCGGVP